MPEKYTEKEGACKFSCKTCTLADRVCKYEKQHENKSTFFCTVNIKM